MSKYNPDSEVYRLLGRAEALIELMRDRLYADESSYSIRLIDGANQWLVDLDENTKNIQDK